MTQEDCFDKSIRRKCEVFSTTILDLPDEILIEIFKYFSTFELIKNVALVNSVFYRLAMDSR